MPVGVPPDDVTGMKWFKIHNNVYHTDFQGDSVSSRVRYAFDVVGVYTREGGLSTYV